MQKLTQETQKHIMGMQYQLRTLDSTLTTLNYNQLDGGQKALMISLKNHVESLCLLMKKKVEL